jgi:hypothetical protein
MNHQKQARRTPLERKVRRPLDENKHPLDIALAPARTAADQGEFVVNEHSYYL